MQLLAAAPPRRQRRLGLQRVALPAPLMQHAVLQREIVVVGVRDRLEIWDRGAWERGLADLEGSAENVAERLVRDAR